MDFTVARSGRAHAAAWLEIDGFPYVFYMGNVAPTVASPRTAKPGLNTVGELQSRQDLMEALSQPATLTVTVGRLRGNQADGLLRRAPSGSSRYATLASTVPQGTTGPYSVTVNEDISAWPATGVLWIGQEALAYGAKDNATKTFTVLGTARGYYGSVVQEHVADATEGWAPRVYAECVAWQRRRARVWADPLLSDGTYAGEPYCEIDGWIRGTPQRTGDDLIEIQIESNAAALSLSVGGEEVITGLQQGQHAFDGETSHRLNTIVLMWPEGAAFSERTYGASALGGGAILSIPWDVHQDVFDASLATDNRAGPLLVGGIRYEPAAAGTYAGVPEDGTGSINITGVLSAAIPNGKRVRNLAVTHNPNVSCLTSPGTAEVVGWPDVAVGRFLAGLRSGTTKGANALWADGQWINTQTNRGLRFTPNWTAAVPGHLMIATRDPDEETCGGFVIGDDLPFTQAIGDNIHQRETYAPGWTREPVAVQQFPGSDAINAFLPCRGWPLAFHDPDERWIHAELDVFSTPSVASPIYVEAVFTFLGQERRFTYIITDKVAASTVTASAKGVLLERAPWTRGMGYPLADWPGADPVQLRQVVAWERATPTRVMLELLLSGQGNGFNHATYDRLPFGANLTVDQVDVASFERYPVPTSAAQQGFTLTEGVDLAKELAALCKQIGAALVERLDRSSGRRRLALVEAGQPTGQRSAANVTDSGAGSWMRAARPRAVVDEKTINLVLARCNWVDGEHTLEVPLMNRDARQEAGKTTTEELDLLGVRINAGSRQAQRAALLPVAAERWALFAYPRAVVGGGLSYAQALLVDAGSEIVISASDVHDVDGSRGLSAVRARVVGVRRNLMTGAARVDAVHWGTNTGGIAPALTATAAPAANQLTVAANAHTETTDPITGAALTDVSYYQVGDAVEVIPLGNWAGRVTTTITAIAGNTITLGAAHGLAAPNWGTVRPQAFDSCPAHLQAFIFLADDGALVGAANNPAWVFA